MSVTILSEDSPLARTVITHLRDRRTKPPQYREGIHRVSLLLVPEALRYLDFYSTRVRTPLGGAAGTTVGCPVALIPIMRAGEGMLPAFLTFVPDAAVWHITVSRDEETLQPIFKDSKIPKQIEPNRVCFVLDPMLATGGSASFATQRLKDAGAKCVVFVGIFGAPEGVARLERDHPNVPVILAVLDQKLNERGYILPGCGDAGDRQFPPI